MFGKILERMQTSMLHCPLLRVLFFFHLCYLCKQLSTLYLVGQWNGASFVEISIFVTTIQSALDLLEETICTFIWCFGLSRCAFCFFFFLISRVGTLVILRAPVCFVPFIIIVNCMSLGFRKRECSRDHRGPRVNQRQTYFILLSSIRCLFNIY